LTAPFAELRIVVLCGGVGAARFLEGLVQVVRPQQITAIVNTGDDAEFYGLYVSPDLDTVMYTLAGVVNPETGWGLRDDTYQCQEQLTRYGEDTWFRLGDRDLATHLRRSILLQSGLPLSEITRRLCESLGVEVRLLPMSDDPVRTMLNTPAGMLPFQEYFVLRGQRDEVRSVHYRGVAEARPAPGVLESIREADLVIVAPSNPFVSVAPVLAVKGIEDALHRKRANAVGISPILGGAAVKGPAAQMLRTLGMEVSAYGVANRYRDLISTFIVDEVDAELAPRIERLDLRVVVAPTLMTGLPEKRALAQCAIESALAGKKN
jgi:LPPG:FO 2-phospho-L-lactate transferase